jgi:hypothetical protein
VAFPQAQAIIMILQRALLEVGIIMITEETLTTVGIQLETGTAYLMILSLTSQVSALL